MSTNHSSSGKSETHDRILAAAAELFARYGYNGVSTREVASAAAVNEVTVYRHYSKKRDLYFAVLEAQLQHIHLRGDLLARIAEAQDGRAALESAFQLISVALLQRRDLLRLVQYGALDLGEEFDQLLKKHLGEFVEVLSRYLDPWVTRGELPPVSPKALILVLLAIVSSHRTLQRVFSGESVNLDEMFKAYADITTK